MAYAQRTDVSVESSQAQIQRLVTKKFGAHRFVSSTTETGASIAFQVKQWRVRFCMRMPDLEDFGLTDRGRRRTEAERQRQYEAEERRRWRALLLVIKAKFESVETGITTFEEEFFAHLILPNGDTASDWLLPQIDNAIQKGKMPPMLPEVT